MMVLGRLAAAGILGIAVLGGRVQAQNTSFMDMNMEMGCMLMAGMHEMQVAVYQSGSRDDSCPELSSPGQALITLTSAAKELRDLSTEVRLVRGGEADGAAADAKFDPVTVAHVPPKTYPTGAISLPANFDMSGRVVMSVGEVSRQWLYAGIFSAALVAIALGVFVWDHQRKLKHPAKSA